MATKFCLAEEIFKAVKTSPCQATPVDRSVQLARSRSALHCGAITACMEDCGVGELSRRKHERSSPFPKPPHINGPACTPGPRVEVQETPLDHAVQLARSRSALHCGAIDACMEDCGMGKPSCRKHVRNSTFPKPPHINRPTCPWFEKQEPHDCYP